MTMLLLLHAQADITCAEQVRTGLEAEGYRIWHEPLTLSLNDPANPKTRAGAILSCAAVVLVWSKDAAQSGDVMPYLPLIQQLAKPVYVLLLDNTALPQAFTPTDETPPRANESPILVGAGLVSAFRQPIATFIVQAPCANVVAQLLPQLPSQQSMGALFTLYEKAAHEYISVRKEAVALAAEMLRRGEEQAQVRAVLEYLASKDGITSVREMAQEVLQGGQTPPPQASRTSSHNVEVLCPACGHVNYFDKRVICKGDVWVYRGNGGGASDHKRELYLECKKCRKPMVVLVDCRGYG